MEEILLQVILLGVVICLALIIMAYRSEENELDEWGVKRSVLRGVQWWQIFVLFILSGIIENAYVNRAVAQSEVLSFLNHPISTSLFGSTKTYRGFVLYPLMNMILAIALCRPAFNWSWVSVISIGLIGRFFWSLGELPNSYAKRCMNIKSGQESLSTLQWIFDHSDSSLALILFLRSSLNWPIAQLIPFMPLAVGCHAAVAAFKSTSSSKKLGQEQTIDGSTRRRPHLMPYDDWGFSESDLDGFRAQLAENQQERLRLVRESTSSSSFSSGGASTSPSDSSETITSIKRDALSEREYEDGETETQDPYISRPASPTTSPREELSI
jgi:hypothetical protein